MLIHISIMITDNTIRKRHNYLFGDRHEMAPKDYFAAP